MQQRPVRPANWKGVADGFQHAQTLLKQGKLREAKTVLQDILEFSHTEAKVWHLLGRIQQIERLHDDALHSFKKARQYYKQVDIKQRAAPMSLRLAKLMMTQGDEKSAKNMLNALINKTPDNIELQKTKQQWQRDKV